MRSGQILVLAMLSLGPAGLRAERVVLKDGSVLQGQLLSFSAGSYELQIGKFIKKIPEASIQTVEGDDEASLRPAVAAPAAPAVPVAPPAADATAGPPGTRPAFPRAATTQPAMPPLPSGGGMAGLPDLSSLKSLEGLDLKNLGQMTQMLGPLLNSAGGAGGATIPQGTALNDVLGSIMRESSVMSQGPEAASKSPGFQQLHAKLADPAFQQQLMSELRAMQQQTGNTEAAGMIQMLEGLMGQLTPPPNGKR